MDGSNVLYCGDHVKIERKHDGTRDSVLIALGRVVTTPHNNTSQKRKRSSTMDEGVSYLYNESIEKQRHLPNQRNLPHRKNHGKRHFGKDLNNNCNMSSKDKGRSKIFKSFKINYWNRVSRY